jgi:polygalacturonase
MSVLRYLPLLFFFILFAVPNTSFSRPANAHDVAKPGVYKTAIASALNVREFGALGDGQHNDAPAFQKALDEAFQQKKSLHVPSGKYYFPSNSTVTVPSGIDKYCW